MKQLLSWSKVSLALDRWISTTKLTITSVIEYYMDQNLEVGEVEPTFDEVDHLSFSVFYS